MADLLTTGRPVNTLNVLIAGIAITNGAEKIATRDKDFMEIWSEENNIAPSTITLYRYHDGEWQPLTTTLTGQRADFTSIHRRLRDSLPS